MESKALNYLSLARKAGRAELGEEPVGDVSRTGKAYVIAVASDASDHTWRRAKAYAAGTEQQCVRLPFSKDELGSCLGRTSCAMLAVSDVGFAAAVAEKLAQADPETYGQARDLLSQKSARAKKRRDETRAHEKNLRRGKPRKEKSK